jgi:hypothetical protein
MRYREFIKPWIVGPMAEWEIMEIGRACRTPNGKGINLTCLTDGGERVLSVRKTGGEKYNNVAITEWWDKYLGLQPSRLDCPKTPKGSVVVKVVPIE